MESLIRKSIEILTLTPENHLFDWIDLADVITGKLRAGIPLSNKEDIFYTEMSVFCRRIKLDCPLVLYRGLTVAFDPLVAQKQPNSTSPSLETAKGYGAFVVKVVVPAGSHAFYTSAWQHTTEGIEEQDEKEVLLLPGLFVSSGEEDGVPVYRYSGL